MQNNSCGSVLGLLRVAASSNNQSKQVRVELPFSTYVTAKREEVEQDVWLAGLVIGGKGATIRAGAHRKIGLVFHKSKLPAISIDDQLYVVVELPKTLLQYTFAFRCSDQARRKFVLVEVKMQPSNKNEINRNVSIGSDIPAHAVEIFYRLDRLESRFEESINQIGAVLEKILVGQSTGLEAITHLHHHSTIDKGKFAASLAELRQTLHPSLLSSISTTTAVPQRTANSEPVSTKFDSMEALSAWLVEQDFIPLSELRTHLLPNAFIDEINERALDLTGEPALIEDSDNVAVQREILMQVIAA